jgi:hypothetical protein
MRSYFAEPNLANGGRAFYELLEARDVERLLNADQTGVAADSHSTLSSELRVAWFKTSLDLSVGTSFIAVATVGARLVWLDLGWLQVHRQGQALSIQGMDRTTVQSSARSMDRSSWQ